MVFYVLWQDFKHSLQFIPFHRLDYILAVVAEEEEAAAFPRALASFEDLFLVELRT